MLDKIDKNERMFSHARKLQQIIKTQKDTNYKIDRCCKIHNITRDHYYYIKRLLETNKKNSNKTKQKGGDKEMKKTLSSDKKSNQTNKLLSPTSLLYDSENEGDTINVTYTDTTHGKKEKYNSLIDSEVESIIKNVNKMHDEKFK